jgi:YidC/Oxa1 family membrane protein insertase
MPDFINLGQGIFGLGPYFNILPLATIVLFIWQQKMFMPPPTDEQAAMQQKIMKYMMIFMGFLFYKVASGLCLYFCASTTWSILERKLMLPKGPDAAVTAAKPQLGANPRGGPDASQRQRQRRK